MKLSKKISIFLLGCLAVVFSANDSWTETKNDADIKKIVKGNTEFAFELYAQMKNAGGSLFFSPHSISTALAMAYGGARGNTEKQMAKTLHFTLDQKQLHPAFAGLKANLDEAQAGGDIALNIANALWAQADYKLLKNYLTMLKLEYKAELKTVDFKRANEKTRKKINAWVEKETKNKIKDLIKFGALARNTRLILVNAIYFKGNWSNQFEKAYTREAPFYIEPGKTVTVPLMNQTARFAYGESDNLHILELPYGRQELSMIVLLPQKADGLEKLEKKLCAENLETWLRALKTRKVKVFLPKFKQTFQFGLSKMLSDMGMPSAFETADFSGMDGTRELFISAVLHKACIDVNEEGTEAAAATALMVGATAATPPPPVFRADHPFVFLIRENKFGGILFLGRVVNPGE